jgi:hypothetical protein
MIRAFILGLFVLFLAKTLPAFSASQLEPVKIWCIERNLADSPSWEVSVNSQGAKISGNVELLGKVKNFEFLRKSVEAKRLPFGVFVSKSSKEPVEFGLAHLYMIGSEPHERYLGWISRGPNQHSEVECHN